MCLLCTPRVNFGGMREVTSTPCVKQCLVGGSIRRELPDMFREGLHDVPCMFPARVIGRNQTGSEGLDHPLGSVIRHQPYAQRGHVRLVVNEAARGEVPGADFQNGGW